MENENETILKFVYEDDKQIKLIRGKLLYEDEFTYKIETTGINPVIIFLGKRSIIKVSPEMSGGQNEYHR
jgi:hypothetical protein